MGPSTRAFLGGTANYAPLDAELDAEWLHKLDVRLARLPRQSLHMGMASRLFHYLPPRAGGLDLPCAVIDYGILPRVRELLLELNDPGSWGKLARALWDHTRIPVEGIDWATDPDAVTRAATDASRSHIGRCCAMLGGYGIFIRDLRLKTHARAMDLLAESVLRTTCDIPPAEPALAWDPRRHSAWAAFALGSPLEAALARFAPLLLTAAQSPPPDTEPNDPLSPWAMALADLEDIPHVLPRRAARALTPETLRSAWRQVWAEATADARSLRRATGRDGLPPLGTPELPDESHPGPGGLDDPEGCPLAATLDAPLPRLAVDQAVLIGSDGGSRVGAVVARHPDFTAVVTGAGWEHAPGVEVTPLPDRALPLPALMGHAAASARLTEGAAALEAVLVGESLGTASMVMDARTELMRLIHVRQRRPRDLLARPDLAGALRTRRLLARWASHTPPAAASPQCPQMWLHDQLRSWHEKEEEDSRTQNRRPRFKLWELSSPPLALAWLNSHQDLKFSGEPPTPNLFATSANTAADEVAGTQEPDDAGPHPRLEPPVLWPAGLPRFWISFDR